MGDIPTQADMVLRLDHEATEGLAGVNNSLAYRVHEIEKHFHSIERWYGTDGDSTMSTANNHAPWTLTASATPNAFGTEVQLSAANDVSGSDFPGTPVKFDLHRIAVTESNQNDKNYIIQIWRGASTFGAATLATEIPYRTASNSAEATPIGCQMARANVTDKLWARVKCETASKTLDILVGIHAYTG